MRAKITYAAIVLVLAGLVLGVVFTSEGSSSQGELIVNMGGAADYGLGQQCSNAAYVADSSDHIVDGTVTATGIITPFNYANIRVNSYEKGAPYQYDIIKVVTDATGSRYPVFTKGEKVRLFLQDYQGDPVAVCGLNGVQQISA